MLLNALRLSLITILRNPVRSSLTVLGVIIGVAAVITMVTLGNGATLAISQQIEALGGNLLIVRPGQRMGGPGGAPGARPPSFRLADLAPIKAIPDVQAAVATENAAVTAIHAGRNWATQVAGVTEDFLEVRDWVLADGRDFNDAEMRGGRAVCIVGDTLRRELFSGADPVGAQLRIKGFSCEIIGLLKAKGQGGMGQDQDDTILMPLRAVQRRISGDEDVGSFSVKVADGASTQVVQARLQEVLRERRRIGPLEEDNFSVMDTRQIAETVTSTTRVLTMLLGAVAAVSLIVGGIGIMNIMLVSVTERTREIGVRLAIGALERDVLLQFLIEAVVLAALGGLAGIAFAAVVSVVLARVIQVPFVFDPGINILAFAISVAIGVFFGYFPASRAARLDPIEALRRE